MPPPISASVKSGRQMSTRRLRIAGDIPCFGAAGILKEGDTFCMATPLLDNSDKIEVDIEVEQAVLVALALLWVPLAGPPGQKLLPVPPARFLQRARQRTHKTKKTQDSTN